MGLFSVLGALFLAAIGVKAYSAIETSQDRSGYLAQFGGIDHQLDDLDDILSRWERQNVVIYDEDTKLKALFDSPPDNLGLMFPSIKPADDRLMRALKDFGQLPESPSESIRRDLKGRNSIPTSELGALIEQEQAKRSYALTEYHAAMAEFRSQLKQIKERLGIQ